MTTIKPAADCLTVRRRSKLWDLRAHGNLRDGLQPPGCEYDNIFDWTIQKHGGWNPESRRHPKWPTSRKTADTRVNVTEQAHFLYEAEAEAMPDT